MTERGPFPLSTAVDALIEAGSPEVATRWLFLQPPASQRDIVAELIAQLQWFRGDSDD